MRYVRMTYVGQLILLLYEEEIFIAMQIPPKIPQKMFSPTLSRWRRRTRGGGASIHHRGIKIYWKMLVDCAENNCLARKHALK